MNNNTKLSKVADVVIKLADTYTLFKVFFAIFFMVFIVGIVNHRSTSVSFEWATTAANIWLMIICLMRFGINAIKYFGEK